MSIPVVAPVLNEEPRLEEIVAGVLATRTRGREGSHLQSSDQLRWPGLRRGQEARSSRCGDRDRHDPAARPLSLRNAIAVLVVALPLTACGAAERASGPPTDAIVERLIDSPPRSLDSQLPSDLFDVSVAVDWTFGGKARSAGWSLSGDRNRLISKRDRLLMVCGSPPCPLSVKTDFPAGSVDAIEIRLAGARSTRIAWTTEGGPVDHDRVLVERFLVAGSLATVRFEVGREAGWSGMITRLEVEPIKVPGQRVNVFSVRGLKYRLSEASAHGLVSEPWAVTLAEEIRPAFLALPDRPIEWSTVIPDRASLRFGTAVPATWDEEAQFEIVAHSDGVETPLFSQTRAPGQGWREHEVDLAQLRGREVTFEFKTSASEIEPILGFAAWSNPELCAASSERRPNIVLVSIDTLRVDHLSFAGYRRPTTPHIDRFLAERGIWLRNTVTSAPWTLPAHVSLVTGIDAVAHGVNHKRPMPDSLQTLARILRAQGYRTVGFVGGGWLSGRYGFDRGFDRYRAWPFGRPRKNELEEHVDQILEWLPVAPQPFLLFLHTFEVHSPHDRSRPFVAEGATRLARRTRFFDSSAEGQRDAGYALNKKLLMGERPETAREVETEEDWRHAIAAYDNGILHMDSQIGRLLAGLEGEGPTVVILTSDHGEALGEHGLASHGYLYDHNLMVPLVIALPGESDPGRAIDQQVRLVDIVPTVLDFADVPVPDSLDGRSLRRLLSTGRDDGLPRVANSYASSSNFGLAVRTANRLKYLFNNTPWPPIAGAEALFDLRSDPAELTDLSATITAAELARMRGLATAALARRTPNPVLRLQNNSGALFSGTLTGGCIQPLRMTSPTAGSVELAWLGAGRAGFNMPPGTVIELSLEAPGVPCVTITGELAGGPSLSKGVDDPVTGEAFGWSLADGGFERIDDRHALTVGFWWIPATVSIRDVDPAADDLMRQELEALGYLN